MKGEPSDRPNLFPSDLPIFPQPSNSNVQPRAVFCEVFAGCGRLSKIAYEHGFGILPVDGPRNEHTPECQLLTLDLTESEEQQCLIQMVSSIRPQAIHVALPCGTGSRARDDARPGMLIGNFRATPYPLWRAEFSRIVEDVA